MLTNLDTLKYTSTQADNEQQGALTSIIVEVQSIIGKRGNRRIVDATQVFEAGMENFFSEFPGHRHGA